MAYVWGHFVSNMEGGVARTVFNFKPHFSHFLLQRVRGTLQLLKAMGLKSASCSTRWWSRFCAGLALGAVSTYC